MGNCYQSKVTQESVSFEKNPVIFINRSEGASKYIPPDRVKFRTTDPFKQFCEKFEVNNVKLRISSCVVPGQDPRGEMAKVCQDNVMICYKQDFLLAMLFDGHGSKGEKVVEFTEAFMKKFFEEKDFSLEPEETLRKMFMACDVSLQFSTSNINCYGSGTTAVAILFTHKGIYSASVGDSRAILATLPQEKYIPEPIKPTSPYRTQYIPLRVLESIQLTLDQKPNLEEELARIVSCGGIVSKVKDSEGNLVGPYRVFQKGKQIPGLAMSRSLGDGAAKKVGVVANPIINFYPIVPFRDQFIIIGSDGVWDTMDNADAVNFVEKFKNKCLKSLGPPTTDPVNPNNSTISQLLVEEARYRWFGVCCAEDVLIDDISAIVIEITTNELASEIDELESRISYHVGSYLEVNENSVSNGVSSLRDTIIEDDFDEEDFNPDD